MKRNDKQQLKNKPVADLISNLRSRQEKLRDLKFDLAAGKIKNIKEIRDTKKTIARIKTFINQREK